MDQLNTTTNTFRADVEHENQVSTKPPQCILDLPQANPQEREMTVDETKKAMKDMAHHEFLMMEYPRRTKFRVDPTLPGQLYGLISFIPAKNAKPDTDGCFGVLKLRGTFPSVNEADRWAENILRNYDSYSDIDYCYVGKDFPLMVDNTAFCTATREIDIRKKVEETVKEAIKQKKEEEKKEMEEIQERQQRLLNNKDEKVDIEDIDFYTQLRVKKANAQYMMEECRKRISECADVINRTDNQIADLDEKFPDYKKEFMSKYRHALDSIGSDASQNPLIKFMEADEQKSNEVNDKSQLSLTTVHEEDEKELA